MGYPAAGTLCISILPSAPTNRISESGCSVLMALAMDTAGKICPPVPPPLMIILKFFFILPLGFEFANLGIYVVKSSE
jgi:hypothetical protein